MSTVVTDVVGAARRREVWAEGWLHGFVKVKN
jgi:hypothetical protein